ncbi:MAG: hypothetical protein AB7F41_04870 [Methylocystis sp.]|uniref:hypothetical protein n=1 Tax=Methylocystis sp. TaxID=1911079 RepID=UPI003D0AA09C
MLQTAEGPHKKRKAIAKRPINNRSRVTTGRSLFVVGDARGAFGRRFKDLVFLHCEDLGGVDTLSEFQLSLVRRVATLEVELERMESELAEGGAIDLDVYARCASHLRRIVETLGLRRVARDVSETIEEIAERYRREEAERAAEAQKPLEPAPAFLPDDGAIAEEPSE